MKSKWLNIYQAPRTGVSRLSVKGQVVNIFDFAGQTASAGNYCTLPLHQESNRRQYPHEWAWLSSNKTLFTKAGRGPDVGWVLLTSDFTTVPSA